MLKTDTAQAPQSTVMSDQLAQQAVQLAADILRASRTKETARERAHIANMARMMQDEAGKKFTIVMADQLLKIHQPHRAAQRLAGMLSQYGIPQYFGWFDRAAMWTGSLASRLAPGLVIPAMKQHIRKQAAHVIVSSEPGPFTRYQQWRASQGIRINFNQLGEAVLGDREADRRFLAYLERLQNSDLNYFSVKLSSVVSQIVMPGYAQTVELTSSRLRELYRAALHNRTGQSKFVNLDMEEYRDLHLTVDVFRKVLDEPEFQALEAGIVLQAYLPDSYSVQQELTEWARHRQSRGGAGIKIRLVKGANLAMEQVEASLRGWEQAPYQSKLEVDANFKRMLEFGTRPENATAVRLGIASHNLFDIALAILLRRQRGVESRVEFEMLEGMANGQALEVRERTGGLVIYTPAVPDEEFEAAIAYLVRRLDENTAPGSFLGALFGLQEGSANWNSQRDAFMQACHLAQSDRLSSRPNRQQNRSTENPQPLPAGHPFANVPDTDFSLPVNRQWIEQIIARCRDLSIAPIPLEIGGEIQTREASGIGRDPSRPGIEAYRYTQATAEDVDRALAVAVTAQSNWEELGIAGRARVLRQVAAELARQRGETIGAMLVDAGKTVTEADVEVSEAIDFANYYALSLDDPAFFDGVSCRARGVVVVTPPWNFPYAIPAGGVLAALMAGNAVILKPSRETVLTAWMLARQLWQAGVPRDVLQFLPTADRRAGQRLVEDSRTAAVILTGSYDTARTFQTARPDLPLFAETSGKNAMIITVNADWDLAIKDLVRGAFGHSGQKCSATSLALIEAPVYDSEKFRQQLKDAAESLIVGGSWNPMAIATPVIREPDDVLRRGLTTLDPGESWLLEPKMVDGNPCLWSPGIKLGVQPGSWYHRHECFGPVLGLIRAESLRQAIDIQNSSHLGLTGGLHSLDPEEIRLWREQVEVGNAYINRGTTGAIVQRQPFGGWKDSCVGPGAKAGGPNYVACFSHWHTESLPQCRQPLPTEIADLVARLSIFVGRQRELLTAAAESCWYWWERYFSKEHDPSQLHGETNHFRYRPRPWHVLRVVDPREEMAPLAISVTTAACRIAGVPLTISVPHSVDWLTQLTSTSGGQLLLESRSQFVQSMNARRHGSLRWVNAADESTREAFPGAVEIGNTPVYTEWPWLNGRLELLTYLREQSVSQTVHRYGNLI